MTSVYDFDCKKINGDSVSMRDYSGKVLLIVNTASACGFTPQYKGLQALYDEYADQGLEILGFPCNQFANQEKGDEAAISEFCELNFGVSFPLFAKIDVNGDGADPLFQHLKTEAKGLLGTTAINWNFTKFLVNKQGRVIKRYGSTTTPEAVKSDIIKLLEEE